MNLPTWLSTTLGTTLSVVRFPSQRSQRRRTSTADATADGPTREGSTSERFVASDGVRLHVVASDKGRASRVGGGRAADAAASVDVTVICLHGWTLDHRTWAPVVQRLTDDSGGMGKGSGVRVLRYDHRGHGRSEHRDGTATLDRLADDLAELIDELAPAGPVVLAGHSMGGMTIMTLAKRHPELVRRRVAAVALVSTSCGNMDRVTLGLPGPAGDVFALGERVAFRLLARAPWPRMSPWGTPLRLPVRLLAFGTGASGADVADAAASIAGAHPASVAAFRQSMAEHDQREALAVLGHIPVAVLAGDRDRLCPLSHSSVIAGELPEAELAIYPGAGHMLTYERAEAVAAGITRLVNQVRVDAAAETTAAAG